MVGNKVQEFQAAGITTPHISVIDAAKTHLLRFGLHDQLCPFKLL